MSISYFVIITLNLGVIMNRNMTKSSYVPLRHVNISLYHRPYKRHIFHNNALLFVRFILLEFEENKNKVLISSSSYDFTQFIDRFIE